MAGEFSSFLRLQIGGARRPKAAVDPDYGLGCRRTSRVCYRGCFPVPHVQRHPSAPTKPGPMVTPRPSCSSSAGSISAVSMNGRMNLPCPDLMYTAVLHIRLAYDFEPGGLRPGSPPSPPPHSIRPTVRRLLRSPRFRVRVPTDALCVRIRRPSSAVP